MWSASTPTVCTNTFAPGILGRSEHVRCTSASPLNPDDLERRPNRPRRARSGHRRGWLSRHISGHPLSPGASARPHIRTSSAPLFAQRSEARANLFTKELRLLPRCEVAAFGELVVVDELGIRPLCPAPRGWIEFVREDAHGNRDGDAFGIEIAFAPIFPIQTGARKRRVRQPSDRYVVEDVVACKALGLS